MSIHLKLALRQLFKTKFHSFINIFGLAMGIAVSSIILITVAHEMQYDRFHAHSDRIYRIEMGDWALMSPDLAPRIHSKVPEVSNYARFSFYEFGDSDVSWKDHRIKLQHFLLSDTSLFTIFSFKLTEGNIKDVLATPFSVVLTESAARSLFGNANATGEIIRVNNRHNFVVTGIIKDEPFSSMPFDAIGSFETIYKLKGKTSFPLTHYMNFQEYLFLGRGTDSRKVSEKINDYLTGLPEFDGMPFRFHLRPLKDIYFSNDIKYEGGSVHGNAKMLKILIFIAIIILFLAVINFINLSTARSGLRARETAVRKVFGASRKKIVLQYLGESMLISFFAFVVSMIMVELSLPFFSRLFGKQLSFGIFQNPLIPVLAILAIVFIGLLSGLYPAFYMSRYDTLKVMKGELLRGRTGIRIRRLLIVSQFIIASGLILATQVIHRQVNFMRSKDLGFRKDNVICTDLTRKHVYAKDVFREKLLAHPEIRDVTFTNATPGYINWQESWTIDGKIHQFTYLPVDENYIDFMGLELIKGQQFSRDRPSEKDSVLIFNETAIAEMGLSDPVGYVNKRMGREEKILGVVRDFHFNSLHAPIAPLALVWYPNALIKAMIRIQPGAEKRAVRIIRDTWQSMDPESIFNYRFLDQSFDQLYKNDIRFGRLFNWFTMLSLVIAGLGLFGMASHMTGSRKREIAVRKVNGASVADIVRLYLLEFLIWVVAANIIALPLVTFAIRKWLDAFPYQPEPDMIIYLTTLTVSLAAASLTVLWHTVRAGYENPSATLKYE